MEKHNLFIEEDREFLLKKIIELIENMDVIRENPDCDLSFEFVDLPCNRECSPGDEVLMLEARLSGGHVYRMTPYGEIPFAFMGGLEPFNIDQLTCKELSDIYDYLQSPNAFPGINTYRIDYNSGSIFDRELQDSLGLDSIIAFVRNGFNPTEAKWSIYSENPNPRLNDLSYIYRYSANGIGIPTERYVPVIVSRALDIVTSKGARKIGISQITFKSGDGEEYDNDVADSLLRMSVDRWLNKNGNSAKVDEVHLIIDPGCKVKACSRLISCIGNALDHRFIKDKYIEAIFAPIKRGFSVSKGSWLGYKNRQIPGVDVETYFYDRGAEDQLTVSQYKEKIEQFLVGCRFSGKKRIATYGMHLKDDDGRELSPAENDKVISEILQEWIDKTNDDGTTIYYVNQYIPKEITSRK